MSKYKGLPVHHAKFGSWWNTLCGKDIRHVVWTKYPEDVTCPDCRKELHTQGLLPKEE